MKEIYGHLQKELYLGFENNLLVKLDSNLSMILIRERLTMNFVNNLRLELNIELNKINFTI